MSQDIARPLVDSLRSPPLHIDTTALRQLPHLSVKSILSHPPVLVSSIIVVARCKTEAIIVSGCCSPQLRRNTLTDNETRSTCLYSRLYGQVTLGSTVDFRQCAHRACIPASSQFQAGGYLDIKVTNLAPRLILRVRLRAEALKIQPCRSSRNRI
jgi:hypothetical protein